MTLAQITQNPNITSTNQMPCKPSFTGQVYSERGNEYQKSNTGKGIGSALGVTYGIIAPIATQEILSKMDPKVFKVTTGSKVLGAVIGAVIYGLIGLGLGALVDYFINSSRAKDADGKAVAKTKLNQQI